MRGDRGGRWYGPGGCPTDFYSPISIVQERGEMICKMGGGILGVAEWEPCFPTHVARWGGRHEWSNPGVWLGEKTGMVGPPARKCVL